MAKKYLNDIIVFRFIVLLCLIIYHSTAFFIGAWEKPILYEENIGTNIYSWISRGSYAILLEGFTFISGFLFALQIGKYTLEEILRKKAARLLLPAIVWGVVYVLVLNRSTFKPNAYFIFVILNGVGHLWFLPMLFWCFVFTYLLTNYLKKVWKVIFCALILCGISRCFSNSYLGIGTAFKYLLYFVFGFYVCMYKSLIFYYCLKWKWVLMVISISLFVIYYQLPILCNGSNSFIGNLSRLGISTAYKLSGVLSLFLYINTFFVDKSVNSVLYVFSKLSMGIYIFHQMIIDFIYYHTKMPEYVNILLLPAITIVFALGSSVLFSWILLKMKLGKALL